jgi:hypothetical protein
MNRLSSGINGFKGLANRFAMADWFSWEESTTMPVTQGVHPKRKMTSSSTLLPVGRGSNTLLDIA